MVVKLVAKTDTQNLEQALAGTFCNILKHVLKTLNHISVYTYTYTYTHVYMYN